MQEHVSNPSGIGVINNEDSRQKQLEKYFIRLYPFPMKDKHKGASKLRKFCLVTNRSWKNNVNQLALLNAMPLNEFMVQILTSFAIQELQDPLLYRKKIPDY